VGFVIGTLVVCQLSSSPETSYNSAQSSRKDCFVASYSNPKSYGARGYPTYLRIQSCWEPSRYISWKATDCTYPYSLRKIGASDGNKDCLESSPRKIGSKWVVNLRPSNLDTDEDQTWNDLAETTFNMYFKSLFDAWDEQRANENDCDGYEGD